MAELTNRDKILHLIQGEDIENRTFYDIEYYLSIHGQITICGGMEFDSSDGMSVLDKADKTHRVSRNLRSVYDRPWLYPYTKRIYQIEQELDKSLPDNILIEAYIKFREKHPEDGWGSRYGIIHLEDRGPLFQTERADHDEMMRKLLERERKDIFDLWGVNCPPDVNSDDSYNKRLSMDRGMASDWFMSEFKKAGVSLDM